MKRYGVALSALLALTLTACGSSGGEDTSASGSSGGGSPVKVGVLTSTSGLVAGYGKQFIEGFKAGLDHATKGTGEVAGRKIEVTYHDDAGDPAKATAEATDLIGKGYKILTGTVSSGVAMQLAPLAGQNKVLYIAGAAAADGVTGSNAYTFRSGRQTWQDVKAAEGLAGGVQGKKVMVFAQDYAFGQANVDAVKAVLGEAGGATVTPVLVPLKTTDFTPFARQIVDAKPDLVFVAWAGDTAPNMWRTLAQQGVFDVTKVVTTLADRATFGSFGPAGDKIDFVAHYFAEATDNEPAKALASALGTTADIFHTDGFTAAQMVVRAIEQGGDDVEKMITALEGWTFTSPKGEMTIRAEDHALLQPMFHATLEGEKPRAVATLGPEQVAPPANPIKR
ncbi:substrate-binding domain-containing protein [Thermobispora bispora]|uniref:Extracellular ligand-binding receptor n=1 Tax=Thermobispora bispora (strain ATCC 19993 / DSM 43833 / CBS 139.67 / JCM 10125 / KCTC 9307 / NBRC 14880 / R51) TaxID=469371 RepID=D6Y491_THEBD|nr:substrate-binding domain-containing protein [Thermobispora bispora]ADG87145.1 Extracellular ligand-binding receptor [Thermobispora bispora DSM 43833]QSI47111.1 amino acid ABC transporter substrate-binding protein [Thermobispora bispora]